MRFRSSQIGVRKALSAARLNPVTEFNGDRLEGSVLKQLSSILSASNRNNKRIGLTDARVFEDMWFLQNLEGERHSVWETFQRLKDDERHARVLLVEPSVLASRLLVQ